MQKNLTLGPTALLYKSVVCSKRTSAYFLETIMTELLNILDSYKKQWNNVTFPFILNSINSLNIQIKGEDRQGSIKKQVRTL